MADESVDLIYLDPPFNSKATYNVLYQKKNRTASAAQITAFEDTWRCAGTAERMAELGYLMAQAESQARTTIEQQRVALFEKGIWQYKLAGRAAYLPHKAESSPPEGG